MTTSPQSQRSTSHQSSEASLSRHMRSITTPTRLRKITTTASRMTRIPRSNNYLTDIIRLSPTSIKRRISLTSLGIKGKGPDRARRGHRLRLIEGTSIRCREASKKGGLGGHTPSVNWKSSSHLSQVGPARVACPLLTSTRAVGAP